MRGPFPYTPGEIRTLKIAIEHGALSVSKTVPKKMFERFYRDYGWLRPQVESDPESVDLKGFMVTETAYEAWKQMERYFPEVIEKYIGNTSEPVQLAMF